LQRAERFAGEDDRLPGLEIAAGGSEPRLIEDALDGFERDGGVAEGADGAAGGDGVGDVHEGLHSGVDLFNR